MSRLPVIFFGHGSPMIALETNHTTRTWKAMGDAVGKPKAILCVSAHWLTRGGRGDGHDQAAHHPRLRGVLSQGAL